MARLVIHFVYFLRSFPHGAFAIPARVRTLLWKGEIFVVLVLLHATPPDGFCSVLLRRPHLPRWVSARVLVVLPM